MKKFKTILVLLVLFITGCFGPKTELDKFKSYLKKNNDYKCKDNVCTKVTKVGKIIEYEDEINFDDKLLKTSSNGNGGLNVTEKTYNWVTNISTYESSLLGIKITATYNHMTKEFVCNSDYDDKEYVDSECKVAEKSLEELKINFEKIINESGTMYFND